MSQGSFRESPHWPGLRLGGRREEALGACASSRPSVSAPPYALALVYSALGDERVRVYVKVDPLLERCAPTQDWGAVPEALTPAFWSGWLAANFSLRLATAPLPLLFWPDLPPTEGKISRRAADVIIVSPPQVLTEAPRPAQGAGDGGAAYLAPATSIM
jgi:hypothetical protein